MKRKYFVLFAFGIVILFVLATAFNINIPYVGKRSYKIKFEQSVFDTDIDKEIQQDLLIEVFM